MKKYFSLLLSIFVIVAMLIPSAAFSEVDPPPPPDVPVDEPVDEPDDEPEIDEPQEQERTYDSGSTVTKEEKKVAKVNMKNRVSIVLTSDMHSHLASQDGKGGLARVKTAIDKIEDKYGESFILDGGDFSMGTPFQTIFMSHAAELRTMGEVGYDVTTLGNHEFDYKTAGLTKMLRKAAKYNKETETTERVYDETTGTSEEETDTSNALPEIVASNIDWDATLNNDDLKKDGSKLRRAFAKYGVKDYSIIRKNGMKVAVFGLMGPTAISQAPDNGLEWQDYINAAQDTVDRIEETANPDFIVCLSHSGLDPEKMTKGEDVSLAKKVDGIDLILSGHSHATTEEALEVKDTQIVSVGAYTEKLGHVVLKKSGDGAKLQSFKLKKLNSKVSEDSSIASTVSSFKSSVNSSYFSKFGYSYDETLTSNKWKFPDIDEFGQEQGEETLANLIGDSLIYGTKKAEGNKYKEVTAAIVPVSTVRASLNRGSVSVAEAYNISSLGIGPDKVPGYPVVSVYLTGKELKAAAEVDATISEGMFDARLYIAGMTYGINEHRLYLNRAVDIKLQDKKGNRTKIDNDELYRVVGGLYTCRMIDAVKDESNGLISITPKNEKGEIIANYEDEIIYDDGVELKEWYALARYMDSFDNGIPEYYDKTHDRKINANSFNPYQLLKQPNNFGLIVFAIVLIPIVIIAGIIIFIRRRRVRNRGYSRRMFGKTGNRRRRPADRKRSFRRTKFGGTRRRRRRY